jgi:hypothetical protein
VAETLFSIAWAATEAYAMPKGSPGSANPSVESSRWP